MKQRNGNSFPSNRLSRTAKFSHNADSSNKDKFAFNSAQSSKPNANQISAAQNSSSPTKRKFEFRSKSAKISVAKHVGAADKLAVESEFVRTSSAVAASSAAFGSASPAKAINVNAANGKTTRRKIENWLMRRGHSLTFALLFLFTLVLYFRPYEMIPALSAFSSIAWYLAIGTILIFIPSQLVAENSLTARPPEVNYVLIFAFFGLFSVVVARDHQTAWNEFNDPFAKVVLIFIVMANVIRTKKRLLAMIWLSLAVALMMAIQILQNYSNGNLAVEGYRSMAQIKGVFGNPNAQSLHFVMMLPIAVALGIATSNVFLRTIYFAAAALFIAGNMVTFSRGGFLGLIVAALVMAWKLARKNRLSVLTICVVAGGLITLFAPGGYGIRILSIFVPGLDPVGSSNQRSELLKTSLLVTLRNPWGIGMGNFPAANPVGLVTHNSYTQVSAEMGVLALIVYLLFHYEAIRRLFWIEQELFGTNQHNWFYYLSIGLQASFAAWCVGSFFDAAAYQWFLYYLAAYAICLRRVYQTSQRSTVISQQQLVAVS